MVVTRHGFLFETRELDDATRRRISEDLTLPAQFSLHYGALSPAANTGIPWVTEELMIPSFAELPDAQEGYRWTSSGSDPTTFWSPNWVVVASVLADPFFIDISSDDDPSVLFARHGAGAWPSKQVASSFPLFIETLTLFEEVFLDRFDQDVWDDKGLRSDFVDEISSTIAKVLTVDETTNFMAVLLD